MSTWMINGPGQALFLGNPNVSQFNPSGQSSPGQGYVPDEVAKMIVKESGLRKSDTIPKRVIVGYLESMGLSAGLATDVAMVLRNMYGITPTFDEGTLYARSGALIEELTSIVNESYPAPFRIDEPEVLNETDEIAMYIAREYLESRDIEYDVVLEHFAAIGPHDFLDIVEFYEWVGPQAFAYLSDLAVNGPEGLAEAVLEGICFPESSLSEDVRYHIDEMKIPDVKMEPKAKRDARTKKREAAMKRQRGMPVSARSQMKKMAKDRSRGQAEDPLAQRRAGSKRTGVSAMKAMGKGERSARGEALRDRAAQRKATKQKASDASAAISMKKAADTGAAEYQKKMADKKASKDAKRAAMKVKGQKALGLAKKVGGAVLKVGKSVVGGVAKTGVRAVAGVAGATGGVAKSAVAGATGGGAKSGGAEPKKKEGIVTKVAKGIGRFARSVKQGYMDANPGIKSQAKRKGSADGSTVRPPVGESAARSGGLLFEMRNMLDGAETTPGIPEPANVLAKFEASDLVGQAVIESLAQLDWDEVAQIASISMLSANESSELISSFQEGQNNFFHVWRKVQADGRIPSALKKESFALLAALSLDEGVVSALVGYSFRALQSAGPDVSMCIEDAYPDLGKTVYGPAGDPRSGPEMAKSYMSPHPAGTDSPQKDKAMTTRMFSDPDASGRERRSRLADVTKALQMMKHAADSVGVNPEGMFLNTYRDMHREKVRYS